MNRLYLFGNYLFMLSLLCISLVAVPCVGTSEKAPAEKTGEQNLTSIADTAQTPAQQYAGEILSYMMQVTLGKAGNPKMREEWGSRGLKVPLDLETIRVIMTGPEKDPRKIMVLDNNITGLSQVLFYYNESLNLFKGKDERESVFPSVELLAFRSLILQKIHKDEKADMEKLIEKKDQLLNPDVHAADIDPTGMNLNPAELKLLKDVLQSEPFFMSYFQDPFILDALYRMGVIAMNDYTREKIGNADYSAYAPEQTEQGRDKKTICIAILPSICPDFIYQFQGEAVDKKTYPYGFVPNEDYLQVTETLQSNIFDFLQKLVAAQMAADKEEMDEEEQGRLNATAAQFIRDHVAFISMDKRPLVIYPENAERTLQSVCPGADFHVIVLGKNVYLSMNIDEIETYPHVNRMYLDILDIKHSQALYELSQISMFVFNKLKNSIPQNP